MSGQTKLAMMIVQDGDEMAMLTNDNNEEDRENVDDGEYHPMLVDSNNQQNPDDIWSLPPFQTHVNQRISDSGKGAEHVQEDGPIHESNVAIHVDTAVENGNNDQGNSSFKTALQAPKDTPVLNRVFKLFKTGFSRFTTKAVETNLDNEQGRKPDIISLSASQENRKALQPSVEIEENDYQQSLEHEVVPSDITTSSNTYDLALNSQMSGSLTMELHDDHKSLEHEIQKNIVSTSSIQQDYALNSQISESTIVNRNTDEMDTVVSTQPGNDVQLVSLPEADAVHASPFGEVLSTSNERNDQMLVQSMFPSGLDEMTGITNESWADRIRVVYGLVLPSTCAEMVLPVIKKCLTAPPHCKPFEMLPHCHLHLQRQEELCCWHHALSALIGSPLNEFIRDSDWITAALINFYDLDLQQDNMISNVHNKTSFVEASKGFMTPLSKEKKRQSVINYIGRIKSNIGLNEATKRYSYAKDGMDTVNLNC